MTSPKFQQLNDGWNAEPNAPAPSVAVSGNDVFLRFDLNAFQFPLFAEDDIGLIRFRDCSRYRLGSTNDEGWYLGQCRYSKTAPAWGEFYEQIGPDEAADLPDDWVNVGSDKAGRHFLFYFRDDTFECFAADWVLEPIPTNALYRVAGSEI
jgi:hypothetical protein